jgi:hypothetical protein
MEVASMLQGSCHCGAVGWQFAGMPDGATACNCTVCRRYGVLWAYSYERPQGRADAQPAPRGGQGTRERPVVPREGHGINVSGPTRAYSRGQAIDFHFCPTCGCVAFWRAKRLEEDGRCRIAVNLRLTEPGPIAQVPIDHFDGLDTFDDLPRDGRCVADYWF